MNNSCEGCIWFGECKDIERCEYYTPTDDEMDIEEYFNDLAERAAEYATLIEEQDS